MKSTTTRTVTASLAGCATGVFLTLLATAAPAGADPTDPAVPPPTPATGTTIQAAGPDGTPIPPAGLPVPPDGVPHLASPDALPPGSTMDPAMSNDANPNVSYFKDLWHAVQNQEISGKEALLLGVAQRGMNTPYPNQAPGPNVPLSPGDPALAASPPAGDPAAVPPAAPGPLVMPAPAVAPGPPTP